MTQGLHCVALQPEVHMIWTAMQCWKKLVFFALEFRGFQLIALHGYLVHRADRNRHGGGVLIYTKDSFVCNVLNPHDTLEIITLTIRNGVNKACLSLFYRPPASSIELLDDLFLYLQFIQSHYFCNNYILLILIFVIPVILCHPN